MPSVEFLRPRLHGPRFDDGEIPLDFFNDLAALREMVLEVAKWRFLQDNPGRQRSPRGFTSEVDLKLTGLVGGSATPVIGLSARQPPFAISQVPYQKYFEEAIEHIIAAVHMTEQRSPRGFTSEVDLKLTGLVGGSATPVIGLSARQPPFAISQVPYQKYFEEAIEHIIAAVHILSIQPVTNGTLPRKFFAYFDRIGRSLQAGEFIEFSVPSGRISARLDREKRRNMLAISRIRELSQQVSLRGLVSEANQQKMTFELQPAYGTKVSGPIAEQHFEAIIEAFNGYRSGVRVLVHGVARYNQQNRLLRLESVEHISPLDPLDIPARLDEFRGMQDGWIEGSGIAPIHAGLDWLSDMFDLYYPDDILLPHTYPTEEGGVRMEWSVGNDAMILEVDLTNHCGEWLWFDRNSDRGCERTLDLEASPDWEWLISGIQNIQIAGG